MLWNSFFFLLRNETLKSRRITRKLWIECVCNEVVALRIICWFQNSVDVMTQWTKPSIIIFQFITIPFVLVNFKKNCDSWCHAHWPLPNHKLRTNFIQKKNIHVLNWETKHPLIYRKKWNSNVDISFIYNIVISVDIYVICFAFYNLLLNLFIYVREDLFSSCQGYRAVHTYTIIHIMF